MVVDIVVVGGGSAGCVVASRLSEDVSRSVVLLEAGPDYPSLSDLPDDVRDASEPTVGHDWGYAAEPDRQGRCLPLPRARLIGGCSATNACFAVRGAPADYDGWATLGNDGWSFAEVLPYFCRLEADADFGGEFHGRDGPIPIRRHPLEERSPVQQAFIDSGVACGLDPIDDHNLPGAVGIGPTPRNVRHGVRMSASLGYLTPARTRPNLLVRGDAMVDRVEVRRGRAVGVRLVNGDIIEAGRIVLAAGAYGSPAILLRSGIGPARQLAGLGLATAVDLPAVGEHLVDHALVAVDLPASTGWTGARFQTVATLHSSLAAAGEPPDLHLFVAGPFDVGADISPSGAAFGIVVGLLHPQAQGRLRLRSLDPRDAPRIEINHLSVPDDVARIVEGMLLARRIARTEPLAALVAGPELAPGPDVADDDVDRIAADARERVSSYHHPVGTCRMAPDPASGGVVDPHGRVYGLTGLHVVDASIMPAIPSANTNLPTMMLAERISEDLRAS